MSNETIVLAHGGGGVVMRELLEEHLLPALGNNAQSPLSDAECIPGAPDLLMTTDSFVVKPLEFQGGNIGSLAVHGTCNDLAVSGAEPLALSLGLIIEEGMDIALLKRLVTQLAAAAQEAGVSVITGDTKVVARGEADQLFINTAGVGRRVVQTTPGALRDGDCVLINGCIADHGVAVMSQRDGIAFDTVVKSDSAPVWPYVKALLDCGITPRVMRDPTRGGLAATSVELADDANKSIELDETAVPVRPEVHAACEMLGLDPLTVANEGKIVAIVAEHDAAKALTAFQSVPGGNYAAIIGRVMPRQSVSVMLKTRYGGQRIVEMPYGEDLPRIC